MNNLFICHTQAHLILASGLSLGRFKGDKNYLILFLDFRLDNELKARLDDIFYKVLYLQSIYPAKYNTYKAKIVWYPKDWCLIKEFLSEPMDRAFAVCDWLLLVQKTLQRVYKRNNKVEYAWVEDGITAYYKESNIHNGLDKFKFTMLIRRVIVRYLLGVGSFYDRDFPETGGLKALKKAYVCFPSAVREPYKSNRLLVKITDEEFLQGIMSMYPPTPLNVKPNTVILVIDKLDRYSHPDLVRSSLQAYMELSEKDGKHILCKFHPRETMVWDIFNGYDQLDKAIGIESTYVSLAGIKDSITIVGVKSTGLMTAKKMGYCTLSLFQSCGENNDELVKFYSSLGITLL